MYVASGIALALGIVSCALYAQPPGGRFGPNQGVQLDLEGKGSEARAYFQKAIDSAQTPGARANAERDMAMSWAFEGNCKKTGEYEQKIIDYWVTREKEDPGSAFYQEGEMADEAGRVCIDADDLNAAAEWYRKGFDLGSKEPGISADRKALWEFRWAHAQARISARRGDREEAAKHVAEAKAALDKMSTLRMQQQAFFPYLTGYVAFYLGDYKTAGADLEKAQNDPFIQCLLGQTYEKLGERDRAMELYRRAGAARAHNPPAAYAVPFARKKLN
jgi:tetratricopeptide (TPR) repeat protein